MLSGRVEFKILFSVVVILTTISFCRAILYDNAWSVVNGKLMNGGQNVRVQGVSLSCTEFDSPIDQNADGSYVCPYIGQDRQPTEHLVNLSTNWNSQIIRIPVNSQWYLYDLSSGYPAAPSGCQFASVWAGKQTAYGPWSPAGYRQWIDDHVQGVIKLGMIAIIDLHWSDMDGTACCDNGANGCYAGCQQTMADHKSLFFWQYVAAKYCNQSNVWFELYNEPAYGLNNGSNTQIPQLVSGGSVQVSYKNGCPSSPSSTFTFVGMQDLYDSVRATAVCDNIVVVGGADWSWSWHGVLAGPRQPLPNVSWCFDQLCQYGCGIHNGVDLMIGESSRGEGYQAPVSWSNRKWGLNVVYNTHPYQQKGGQRPSQGEPCSNWVEQAINGSQPSQICSEQCGWYTAFGFLTQYVPVIATEMGPWSGFSCDGSYISCQLDWFNQMGISATPWAYWGNNAAQCNGYPTLVNPNWTNNGYGNAVQQFMTESKPPYIVPN